LPQKSSKQSSLQYRENLEAWYHRDDTFCLRDWFTAGALSWRM
jgi:hypothetical protein